MRENRRDLEKILGSDALCNLHTFKQNQQTEEAELKTVAMQRQLKIIQVFPR